jgi:ABC-type sugar transport system substrate-binding protein
MIRSTTALAVTTTLAALVLAACGADADDTDPAAAAAGAGTAAEGGTDAAQERPTLGLQLSLTGIEFFAVIQQGAEQGAADGGADLEVTGPPSIQPDVAVQQFNDLQARTDPYVAVHAAPPDFWVRPLSEATDDGVTLTTIADAPAPGTDVPVYVGDNGFRSGRVLVAEVLDRLPGSGGKVVIGNCVPGFPTQDNRIAGMIAELESSAPDVEIVSADVGIEPAENLANWQNLFSTHPDAVAFLGNCDTSGPNLVRVKQERPGDYLLATFDISAGTLAGIEDGTMAVALGGSPYLIGYLSTRLLAAQAAGQEVPSGWFDTGAEVVDSDNIDVIVAREASPEAMVAYYAPLVDELFADPAAIPTRPREDALAELEASTNDDVVWLRR